MNSKKKKKIKCQQVVNKIINDILKLVMSQGEASDPI